VRVTSSLPARLALLHAEAAVGEQLTLNLTDSQRADDLIVGAGFEVVERSGTEVIVRRIHTLADHVGASMTVLICGLNPSPASADSGIGFHRPGNRFWPAAIAAGLVTVDRDPSHSLKHHGMGMTDLVKRTTRRADELSRAEFELGIERVARLVGWLQPKTVCMVGLQGWRAAVDRTAARGWQAELLGGRPVYLMPSTSGLNAHDTVDSLTDHFRSAMGRPVR